MMEGSCSGEKRDPLTLSVGGREWLWVLKKDTAYREVGTCDFKKRGMASNEIQPKYRLMSLSYPAKYDTSIVFCIIFLDNTILLWTIPRGQIDMQVVVFNELTKKRVMGFEPTTSSLGSWHSTAELHPRIVIAYYSTIRDSITSASIDKDLW